MRKMTPAYNRRQAAERAARKRLKDKALKAPSMAQVTIALGYAARAFIAEHRAAGRIAEMQPMLETAIVRLRQEGHSAGDVTLSRLRKATTRTSPITPSH